MDLTHVYTEVVEVIVHTLIEYLRYVGEMPKIYKILLFCMLPVLKLLWRVFY